MSKLHLQVCAHAGRVSACVYVCVRARETPGKTSPMMFPKNPENQLKVEGGLIFFPRCIAGGAGGKERE